MTKEEAKKLLPIIQGYAEGKKVEKRLKGIENAKWQEVDKPSFDTSLYEFRIKPELKYRPFKDSKECWDEMLKHQPFGWVKRKGCDDMEHISYISNQYCGSVHFAPHISDVYADMVPCSSYGLSVMFEVYSFADGTPYGIKVEE